MLTGIITQDNTVILSDNGYPIIESDKPSVPEYCKAVSRYTETNGKIIQSWEVTPQLSKEEAIDKFIASQVSKNGAPGSPRPETPGDDLDLT